jgi:hypothetical protein
LGIKGIQRSKIPIQSIVSRVAPKSNGRKVTLATRQTP